MDELVELKAHAYDCLAQIELWQKKLLEVNQRIASIQMEQKLLEAKMKEQ